MRKRSLCFLLTRIACAAALEANTLAATLSPEAVAEGTALVEEFLNAWATATTNAQPSQPSNGDDVEMEGAEQTDAELKRDFELLKQCYDEYKPKFEHTTWTRDVLAETY